MDCKIDEKIAHEHRKTVKQTDTDMNQTTTRMNLQRLTTKSLSDLDNSQTFHRLAEAQKKRAISFPDQLLSRIIFGQKPQNMSVVPGTFQVLFDQSHSAVEPFPKRERITLRQRLASEAIPRHAGGRTRFAII